MNSEPNTEEILAALRKSGYLMEQEVATELENLGFNVSTNWAFEDSDDGKSREIDVRGIRRVAVNEEAKINAFIELIVECKNSANPFVFIGRPKNLMDEGYVPQELVFPLAKHHEYITPDHRTYRNTDPFFHLGFDRVHYGTLASNKAVQFCRINRKNKTWEANHGGLFNSMFYPLAKAVTTRKKDFARDQRNGSWRDFWFFMPIVVTSGQVYYVDSSDSEPSPQEQDFVNFRREIRSGELQGTFAVDFVRQNRIAEFYDQCIQPLVDRVTELAMDRADFVLTRDIPWQE